VFAAESRAPRSHGIRWGWTPEFLAEIAPFPSAVLKHHYPEVPNHGDFTTIQPGDYAAIDLLVGGTPCQDFSVAGLRAGINGERGALTVEFARLAGRLRPRWVVWENVPGVLSADGGRAFGIFLGLLGQFGYQCAWRILDAQHFGVPQRRRRVFLVGHLGDWRCAAAVLFERHSLSGNPPPRREARQVAPSIPSRSSAGGGLGTDFDCDGGLIAEKWPADVASTLNAHFGDKMGLEDQHINGGHPLFVPVGGFPDVAHALRADGFDASEDGTGRGTPLVPIAFSASRSGGGVPGMVAHSMAVRRLTPRECERLQGFPDDYTLVPFRKKPAADGPRYKALGNSKAVPVVRWIGQRIRTVEELG